VSTPIFAQRLSLGIHLREVTGSCEVVAEEVAGTYAGSYVRKLRVAGKLRKLREVMCKAQEWGIKKSRV
jgi:hypothetical protein